MVSVDVEFVSKSGYGEHGVIRGWTIVSVGVGRDLGEETTND